jgi:hypothetical protein
MVDGFAYSEAVIAAAGEGLFWNEEALMAWLENPRGLVPGTDMTFPGLADGRPPRRDRVPRGERRPRRPSRPGTVTRHRAFRHVPA